MPTFLLALDQGTTSSRAIIFSPEGTPLATAQKELPQLFPQPGWVEHDPLAIFHTQLATAQEAIAAAKIAPQDIAAIGITNQRETTLLWDRHTGLPLHNALVWQDRRTADRCDALKRDPALSLMIQQKTGLIPDAYFSASKLQWLLDHIPHARRRAARGELAFGTVDSWLLWNLTAGPHTQNSELRTPNSIHATDPSNASRTMLLNIHSAQWDPDLLQLFDIPPELLPQVRPSAGLFGTTTAFGPPIPITGIAGDQQAALFGQSCLAPGQAKNTYGTGCFLLMNTGQIAPLSKNRLLTTIAWQLTEPVASARANAPTEPAASARAAQAAPIPKSKIKNQKSKIPHFPNASIPYPASPTQNSELRTQNSELRTQNSELRTQNSELRTQHSSLTYALEGSVFVGGAVVQWLRDGLGLIQSAADIEPLARSVPDSAGVYLVPAFAGLGAPHWDQYARGTIVGITRGTTKAHLARAALEAIAFQVADLLDTMHDDLPGMPILQLRVDGGAAKNDLLLQFQADLLQRPVLRPAITETTALGAALLAGVGAGVCAGRDAVAFRGANEGDSGAKRGALFAPRMGADEAQTRRQRWTQALQRARDWDQPR